MPYKDPVVRNARQRERYKTDPEFRLKHYEAARKWNTKKRLLSPYKYRYRPGKQVRKINYRLMLIELLIQHNGTICRFCGKEMRNEQKLAIDHIVAVADGGGEGVSNIQVIRWVCNSQKESIAAYVRTVGKISRMEIK